eukprot:8148297-Pyramimonas_sp.AAC.1
MTGRTGTASKRLREPRVISSANAQRQEAGNGRAQERTRYAGSSARANADPEAGYPCSIPDETQKPGRRPPARTMMTRTPEYRNLSA